MVSPSSRAAGPAMAYTHLAAIPRIQPAGLAIELHYFDFRAFRYRCAGDGACAREEKQAPELAQRGCDRSFAKNQPNLFFLVNCWQV